MRFLDGKTKYALREHTGIFIFFRCVRNGFVTETYFGLCILSIQSKTLTTFHLQCVSWYNICVPVNLHIYLVQDESVRRESFVQWRTDEYDIKTLVDAGFTCSDSGSYTVECTSCGLCVNCSELQGAPYDFHKRKSPHCEFFKDSMRSLSPSTLHKNDKTDKTNGRNEDEQEQKYLQKKPPDVKSFSPKYPQYAQAKKRSETFKNENWSNNNQLQTPDPLARAGFFYTGCEDLVRCYYCDGGLKKWEPENDPWVEHARWFPDCHFLLKVKGKEFVQDVHKKRNSEPVQLSIQAPTAAPNSGIESASERPRNVEVIYDRTSYKGETVKGGEEADRLNSQIRNPNFAVLSTYTNWPRRVQDVNELANAGFFYAGYGDTVRCFHCHTGLAKWDRDDDPWVEHARHSPECPYLRKQKGQEYINNIQTQWARIYTPKHPQHSQVEERRRTFRHENWPTDNILQTPDQLAAAGFFYTGVGDTVRCHYCDGGLREWEPEDDPWVEHARWFPFCRFVLKIKGVDFTQASFAGNLSQHQSSTVAGQTNQSRNCVRSTIPVMIDHLIAATENLPPPGNTRSDSQPLSYVDTCRIKEQRNPLYSAAAQSVRSMGYSKATIRMAINCYIENTGRRDFIATDLMDIIFEKEDAGEVVGLSDEEDSDADTDLNLTIETARKENEYLNKLFKCRICAEIDRCIAFLPCGHLIACTQCGEQMVICPVCGSRIQIQVKTSFR